MAAMMPDLEAYFRGLVPASGELLSALEKEALEEAIPIVGPVVGRLLYILTRSLGARAVLELGTATGYSGIHLAQALEQGGKLVTLEMDEAMAGRARANFLRAGLGDRVEVQVGEALKLMAGLAGPFDLIFLDIDKESYARALPQCHRLLRPGGLLVADNVGFTGADEYNRALAAASEWRAVPILCFLPRHSPEKDGLSLAVKIK